MNYQPKGGMCAVCTKKKNDCSKLEFDKMRVIERSKDAVIVKCTEFTREHIE